MKNNKGLFIALGTVAVAGLVFYIIKKFGKKGEQKIEDILQQGQQSVIDVTETPVPSLPARTGNLLGDVIGGVSNLLTNWNKYKVSTSSDPLNVRDKPSSTGKIVGNLKKGTTILAKASGTKGWFAYSLNGQDITGYVASDYLKLLPTKRPGQK